MNTLMAGLGEDLLASSLLKRQLQFVTSPSARNGPKVRIGSGVRIRWIEKLPLDAIGS